MLSLAAAARTEIKDSLRVLWIGNSYTFYNDLPKTVAAMAAEQGMPMSITTIVKGGERLSGHLQNPRLIKALEAGGWDYVIVQEQSSAPAQSTHDVARDVYPYAKKIADMARIGPKAARVIFYMTWGHKYGNVYKTAYALDDDYETMQERLKTSYLEMAHDNMAKCAPVGMAWREIRHTHPDYELYAPDFFHPSPLGSYLAANVIIATILNKPFTTKVTNGLPEDEAKVVQGTAQDVVLGNRDLINVGR